MRKHGKLFSSIPLGGGVGGGGIGVGSHPSSFMSGTYWGSSHKREGGSIHTSEHTQEALNTLLSGPGVLKSGHTGGDPR